MRTNVWCETGCPPVLLTRLHHCRNESTSNTIEVLAGLQTATAPQGARESKYASRTSRIWSTAAQQQHNTAWGYPHMGRGDRPAAARRASSNSSKNSSNIHNSTSIITRTGSSPWAVHKKGIKGRAGIVHSPSPHKRLGDIALTLELGREGGPGGWASSLLSEGGGRVENPVCWFCTKDGRKRRTYLPILLGSWILGSQPSHRNTDSHGLSPGLGWALRSSRD